MKISTIQLLCQSLFGFVSEYPSASVCVLPRFVFTRCLVTTVDSYCALQYTNTNTNTNTLYKYTFFVFKEVSDDNRRLLLCAAQYKYRGTKIPNQT